MSGRIAVLELLPSTPGGGPKQVYDLVRELPKSEFEVVVGAPRDGIFFERFQALGLRVVEFPPSRLGLRHLLLAIRLIRQFDIAVVHTHGKGLGLYGRPAAWWAGVSAVHTFHGIHYASYSRIGRWVYPALERQLSRMSRTIINVSASVSWRTRAGSTPSSICTSAHRRRRGCPCLSSKRCAPASLSSPPTCPALVTS